MVGFENCLLIAGFASLGRRRLFRSGYPLNLFSKLMLMLVAVSSFKLFREVLLRVYEIPPESTQVRILVDKSESFL